VVLDSTLRIPADAKVLDADAATSMVTTPSSSPRRRDELRRRGIHIEVVAPAPRGVDLAAVLAWLHGTGVQSLLVEGGAKVITSMLAAGVVDRLVVGVAPTIIGQGTEAVGSLGITTIAHGIRLVDRAVHILDDDVLLAWDVVARDP
jgi:riboflavin biosynthesis pyrimidine reductase